MQTLHAHGIDTRQQFMRTTSEKWAGDISTATSVGSGGCNELKTEKNGFSQYTHLTTAGCGCGGCCKFPDPDKPGRVQVWL